MKNIKLIIFDLDGTLVDAYSAIVKSFNYTMRKLGYPCQRSLVIRRAVGWGDTNLLKSFIKAKDLKRGVFLYRKDHKFSLIRYAHLFARVKFLLSYLKNKGYKLAVASNRPTKFSRILIRHLKLEKYFHFILCADKLKHIKPHPEILERIVQKLHFLPSQVLYVGDMTIDAQAGRRARVKTIIVTTGSSLKQEIKKERPYLIIRKVGELIKLF